jgi:hypothetical protein
VTGSSLNLFKSYFQNELFIDILNIMAEWLTLLLHIYEVQGSNLGPETRYPEVFMIFLSPYRQMSGKNHKIRPCLLPSKFFAIHHSFITLSFDAI